MGARTGTLQEWHEKPVFEPKFNDKPGKCKSTVVLVYFKEEVKIQKAQQDSAQKQQN